MPRYQVVAQGPKGIAVANLDTGNVYVSDVTGLGSQLMGLAGLSGVNWDKFGNIFLEGWKPIAEGLKNKLSGPAYAQGGYGGGYGQQGATILATPQGMGAGIDTNTLIMLGGIGLVAFMFMKK